MKPLAHPPGLSCIGAGHLLVKFRTELTFEGSWCVWCGTATYGSPNYYYPDGPIPDDLGEISDLEVYGDWNGRDD